MHRLGTRRAKSAPSRHHARLPARRGTALDQAKGVSSTGDCKPVAASRSASESLFSFQKKTKKKTNTLELGEFPQIRRLPVSPEKPYEDSRMSMP